MTSAACGGIMRQLSTPPGSGPQAKVLDMSVPSHADVIVLHRRPGPALRPGDLVPDRRPLRPAGPGEVVVRNIVTSVDPYQLRMLRGSSEVTQVAAGEPVPATSGRQQRARQRRHRRRGRRGGPARQGRRRARRGHRGRQGSHRSCRAGAGATLRSTTVTQRSRSVLRRRRAKLLRVVVSEFEGPDRAPQALATVFDRGSPYIGRRVVRVSEG